RNLGSARECSEFSESLPSLAYTCCNGISEQVSEEGEGGGRAFPPPSSSHKSGQNRAINSGESSRERLPSLNPLSGALSRTPVVTASLNSAQEEEEARSFFVLSPSLPLPLPLPLPLSTAIVRPQPP